VRGLVCVRVGSSAAVSARDDLCRSIPALEALSQIMRGVRYRHGRHSRRSTDGLSEIIGH
jgi:hypothetical protein